MVVDRHLATSADGVYAAGDVTGMFPHTHAAYAMGRVAVGAALRRFRRPSFDATAIPQVVFTDPEPPDEALMLELRRRFKPEVVALSEYLNRDLVTLWGYDRLP